MRGRRWAHLRLLLQLMSLPLLHAGWRRLNWWHAEQQQPRLTQLLQAWQLLRSCAGSKKGSRKHECVHMRVPCSAVAAQKTSCACRPRRCSLARTTQICSQAHTVQPPVRSAGGSASTCRLRGRPTALRIAVMTRMPLSCTCFQLPEPARCTAPLCAMTTAPGVQKWSR